MDLYQVLQVSSTANERQIKQAYCRRVAALHPDVGSQNIQEFHDVVEAYRILRDPERRSEYDRQTIVGVFGGHGETFG